MPTTQKEKIIFLLLHYLALEGAKNHFSKQLPENNEAINALYEEIEEAGFPKRWDKSRREFVCADIVGNTNTKKCWSFLTVIRNNLFHANKANDPDTPERLEFLLNWSYKFISELIKEEHDIGLQAKIIRETLQID